MKVKASKAATPVKSSTAKSPKSRWVRGKVPITLTLVEITSLIEAIEYLRIEKRNVEFDPKYARSLLGKRLLKKLIRGTDVYFAYPFTPEEEDTFLASDPKVSKRR